jgi:hypothetical protein
MRYLTYLQSCTGWRVEALPAFKDDGTPPEAFFYIMQLGDNQKPPEIIKLPIAQLEKLAEQLAAAVVKLKQIDAAKSDDHLEKQYVG